MLPGWSGDCHPKERCCPCEHQALTLVRLSLWSCVPQEGSFYHSHSVVLCKLQLAPSIPASTLDTKEAPNAMADVGTMPSKAHLVLPGPLVSRTQGPEQKKMVLSTQPPSKPCSCLSVSGVIFSAGTCRGHPGNKDFSVLGSGYCDGQNRGLYSLRVHILLDTGKNK